MLYLLCGGRDYNERDWVWSTLDTFLAADPQMTIIHGDGSGLDQLAKNWAQVRGVLCAAFPANWDDITDPNAVVRVNIKGKKYNAAAGPQRTDAMFRCRPDVVIAFPGHAGTDYTINQAQKRGIKVWRPGPSVL